MSYMERDGTGQKRESGMLPIPSMYQALGWANTHAYGIWSSQRWDEHNHHSFIDEKTEA